MSGRFRTISLNDFIERFPESLTFGGKDSKSYVESFLTEAYLAAKYDDFPRVEYCGKVPLPRLCAHGKTMAQLRIKTNNISIQAMQELINMGWRREGNNFYKVAVDCCDTYALRLDPRQFKISRQHRKILNHFADFFKYGDVGTIKKPMKNKKATSDDFTLEAYVRRMMESCEAHKLEIRLVRPGDKIFQETYEEAFELFQKYQATIHKNNYGKEDFDRVCNVSPLKMFGDEERPELFGTFHRQYLIDGRLVGVEMFDVLPNYLLAQTSFYDTDLAHLHMGTFMILEPILFTQKLSETLNRPLYYSTGLYNHCFKKHHYKLGFASEILCADTPNWTPLTKEVIQMLEDSEKILSLNLPSFVTMPKVSTIPCSYSGKIITYGQLREILPRKIREISTQSMEEYVQEVGEVSKKMIVCF